MRSRARITNWIWVASFALFVVDLRAAIALETLPEFQSLNEEEQEVFESPSRISPKYTSDLLAYMKPESWEYRWLTHSRALDLSVGSVSASHFLMNYRLKIHEPISKFIEFRFTYVDERSLERNGPRHAVIELVAWPWKKVGISFYGEPDLYKRNDDTGIALMLRPADHHEIRIFNTFVDVTRLKRNDRADTYIEPFLPYSRGLVGRWWSDPAANPSGGLGDFVEYAFRHETHTRWYFPGENYEYGYWKAFTSFFGTKSLNEDFRLSLRVQLDRTFESRNNASGAQTWRRDRAFTIVRAILPRIGPRRDWELTLGLMHAYRSWRTESGVAFYRDLLPHFWLKFPAFGDGTPEEQDHWLLGMDANWHNPSGTRSLLLREEKFESWLGRVNVAYEFQFGKKGSLRLIATADLDEIGGTKSWGGGCGQFSLYF